MNSTYAKQRMALLTQHGKEKVIGSVLEPALGCAIEHVTGFDTDKLGAFTREIARLGSQVDAARRKARIGMEMAGLSLGLASEGSFGPDPFTGMLPWNVELLILIDDRLGIEVIGVAQGAGRNAQALVRDWESIEAFANRVSFPEHHLVLRPESEDDPRICKDLAAWNVLRQRFDECISQSSNQQVSVETDLRAFANPSRMAHIKQAAVDLLNRLQSCCPNCESPGYSVAARLPGLPCSACGLATPLYKQVVLKCVRCAHESIQPRTDLVQAEPKHCPSCNP